MELKKDKSNKSESKIIEKSKEDKPVNKQTHFNFRNFILILMATAISSILLEQVLDNYYFQYPFNYLQNCSKCYKTVQKYGNLKNINIGSPKFIIFEDNENKTQLQPVKNVLKRIGLIECNVDENWDLLWSQVNPFKKFRKIKKLKQHQIVNHIPEISLVIDETLRKLELPYLPKSFLLPDDDKKFQLFKITNPDSLLIMDNNSETIIKKSNEINFKATKNVQLKEYIENPFLINDYKFEIRLYVIITSINPLRVYIYNADAGFRFGPEKYDPSNITHSNKYSIKNNYTPLWEIPSLKLFYIEFEFSSKECFNAHLKNINLESAPIWEQIEEIIRDLLLIIEENFLKKSKSHLDRNYFQLLRFDFSLTENLKIYLENIDTEPQLSSSYNETSVYFEQIIYNIMRLMDVARPAKRNSFKKQNDAIQTMITSEKNVAIDGPSCLKHNCYMNCKKEECKLCLNCLKESDLQILFKAWREHIHRGDTKRIFPKPIINVKEYNIETETRTLSPANKIITKWFYEKCKLLSMWCM